MTVYDFIEYALLAISVVVTMLGCIGIMVKRDLYDRMHYMGLATSVGAIALAAAVVVQEAAQPSSGKAIIAALAAAITGPVLTHAMARAQRTRELGRWDADLQGQPVNGDGRGNLEQILEAPKYKVEMVDGRQVEEV